MGHIVNVLPFTLVSQTDYLFSSALNDLIEVMAKELNPTWNIKASSSIQRTEAVLMSEIQLIILELGLISTRGTEHPTPISEIHPSYDDPSLPSYKFRSKFGKDFTHAGNLMKATIQIYKLADLDLPSLHFPLGKDAIEACVGQSKAYVEAAEKHASWSNGLVG